MKIYFNTNNKATRDALKECGVRNVMVAHKYVSANISKYWEMFESVFVVAGVDGNADKYHDWLKINRQYYEYATQFDTLYDMDSTIKHYKNERDLGIDWTLPVLQGNYLNHISMLRLQPNSYVCLGEIHGKLETEDQIRKLPANLRYHGLAKGKYVGRGRFQSIDTSAWISAAMSKKTEVWNNNSTNTIFFGVKGKGMIPMLRHACSIYKDNLDKIGITIEQIINGDYNALLKAPIALLFMPQCKSLNMYSENFK